MGGELESGTLEIPFTDLLVPTKDKGIKTFHTNEKGTRPFIFVQERYAYDI